MSVSQSRRVLMIIENLTVPLDRRAWQEALALRDAGYQVSVICPTGGKFKARHETIDGIEIFRHPLPLEADGGLGYILEYSVALFWEFLLSFKVRMRRGFDVIHACNPPDTIFMIAAFWKLVAGTRFVFDHHDLNPELYEAKFGRRGALHRALLLLEKITFKTADVSLATNESYRQIALQRGGMAEDRVFIVRSTPDLSTFVRRPADEALRNGRRHVVGYLGVMGAQDGVENLITAMGEIVHVQKRTDVQCVLVGKGSEVRRLKRMASALMLDGYVTFTGYLDPDAFLSAISTFDIGVVPDPNNPFNDKCSMNKVFEYMALGIPVAGFDLLETQRSAGDAALYATDNDPAQLAAHILTLCDDPVLAKRLGAAGRARALSSLDWDLERRALLAAYDRAFERPSAKPATATGSAAPLAAG